MNKRHDLNMNPTRQGVGGVLPYNIGFLTTSAHRFASAVVSMTQNFTVMLLPGWTKYGLRSLLPP